MAEYSLIDRYLSELRTSVSHLPDAQDIVDEAADHLLTAVETFEAGGMTPADAEREALARYGPVRVVGRAFDQEAWRRGAVATRFTRRAGLVAIVASVLGVVSWVLGERSMTTASWLADTAGYVLLAYAVWGVSRRHGRLGEWGRAAVVVAIAAGPFSVATEIMVAMVYAAMLAVALAGVGMIRARILPAPAVASLTVLPMVLVMVVSARGSTAAWIATPVWVTYVAGLIWVGWTMWREPALEPPAPSGQVTW